MFRRRNGRDKLINYIYLLMINPLKEMAPTKKTKLRGLFLQYDKYIMLEKINKKSGRKLVFQVI